VASDLILDPLLVVRQPTAPPPAGVGRPALSRLDMGRVLWIQGPPASRTLPKRGGQRHRLTQATAYGCRWLADTPQQ
jgi:hypothetical protein